MLIPDESSTWHCGPSLSPSLGSKARGACPQADLPPAEFQLYTFAELGTKVNDVCDEENAESEGTSHIRVVPPLF